ncbi:MAG: hypothetical protein II399_03250 [Lachnospiraceae bacterium]|nr:hypothetical protein [Lachnospiraceae bacterium]
MIYASINKCSPILYFGLMYKPSPRQTGSYRAGHGTKHSAGHGTKHQKLLTLPFLMPEIARAGLYGHLNCSISLFLMLTNFLYVILGIIIHELDIF